MRNTDLLRRVRDKAKVCSCALPSKDTNLDSDKLGGKPLLQSIFAETLRLRTLRFIFVAVTTKILIASAGKFLRESLLQWILMRLIKLKKYGVPVVQEIPIQWINSGRNDF